MRKCRTFFIVLSGLCLFLLACKDERPLYTSPDGQFSIAFSQLPTEASEQVATAYGDIQVNMLLSEVKADEVEIVGYSDYPEEVVQKNGTKSLISNARDGVTSNLETKAFDEKEIVIEGNKGIQFKASGKGFHVTYQLFFVGRRMYQIGLIREKKTISDLDFQYFAGTFDLLD